MLRIKTVRVDSDSDLDTDTDTDTNIDNKRCSERDSYNYSDSHSASL